MARIRGKIVKCLDTLDIGRLPELMTVLFAALLLGLFPLAVWGGYGHVTISKFVVLSWSCGDYLLALLLSLWWTGRWRGLVSPVGSWSLAQRLLLLYLLLALVSALASGSPVWLNQARWDGLLTLALLVFVCLSTAALGSWQDWYFSLAAAAALLMAGLGLWQLGGGNPLGLYPQGMDYYGGGQLYNGRFLGFIGNIDMVSAYWCLLLPLLLGGVLLLPGRRRWLPALALAGGGLTVLLMGVDGGLLALGLTALALGPLLLPPKLQLKAWGLSLLLLLLLATALYCYNGPPQGTLWEASRVLHGELRPEFGSSRMLIWQEALASPEGWQDWLLGTGPGTRARHFTTVFQRYLPGGRLLRAAVDSAHSEYLDDLLELGLCGLLAYMSSLISSLVRAWRRRGDQRTVVLAGAVLCYSLQAAFNLRSVVVAPLFWLIWGLLLARLRRLEGEESGSPQISLCKTDVALTSVTDKQSKQN